MSTDPFGRHIIMEHYIPAPLIEPDAVEPEPFSRGYACQNFDAGCELADEYEVVEADNHPNPLFPPFCSECDEQLVPVNRCSYGKAFHDIG